MKHGFIGFGNLAKAIYNGLKEDKGIDFAYISKSNIHEEIQSIDDLAELVSFSDIIWLCIKPQNLTEILVQLKNTNLENKIIVSPIAGKSIGFIEGFLGKNVPIIRIMPNLAISYKKSVTAFCTNNWGSPVVNRVKNNLIKLGRTIDLPEKHFDLFTAIFGSGPAFFLEILKVFQNKIDDLELPDKVKDEVLIELVFGTMAYFKENHTNAGIDDLIKRIASRGGATEAGLNYFRSNKLDKLFDNAIIAAKNRSKEIL